MSRKKSDNLFNAITGSDERFEKLLDLPVIGVIPYDDNVRKAVKLKHPVTHTHPNAKASKSYEELAGLILGRKYFEIYNKKSRTLQDYVLEKLGLI
jgi:MinD-like ATPase involved in chromosome partitioning or flagellar assembly